MFFSKKWNPDGQHVYITGGSSGLGLALAILLVRKGANVSVVARNQEKLDNALAQMQNARQHDNQKIKVYSRPLTDASDSEAALETVCEPYGGEAPDVVFACAGSAKPMFAVDMTEQDLTDGMFNGYWVQAFTAFATTKKMVRQKRTGKIVLVSSTLGYIGLVGWSSYSPAKQALRALGDCLHSELILYGIDVHTFLPNTILTPGYEEEAKTKPKISKIIEDDDRPVTPEEAAISLFNGVQQGEAHIVGDLNTRLFRASTRGATPHSSWILDGLLDFIGFFAIPIWRSTVDRKVRAHREEHMDYLTSKGFFG